MTLTPNLYILISNTNKKTQIDDEYLNKLKDSTKNKILNLEPVITEQLSIYVPQQRARRSHVYNASIPDQYEKILDNTVQYYGMGVEDAWAQGYTGKGVVIAVTGIGVNIDHPDLIDNINHKLSKTFVNDGEDVHPQKYPGFPETLDFTDHGNRCAGLISAMKGNNICSAGIAYRATIAVLKIFELNIKRGGIISYTNDALLKGLIYQPQGIHIYSNSWTLNKAFTGLTFSAKEIIDYGITSGRNGKGSIYVFPVGQIADGYANIKYSITVGSMGVNGSIADFSIGCACVLISTIGERTNIGSDYIETTSHNVDNCTRDFKGKSASTAMVSAIIALALEANMNLTWRDVQHILVRSSSNKGSQEMVSFKRNGAGHYYHYLFGFGLLNANNMVILANNWTPLKQQETRTYVLFDNSQIWYQEHSLIAKAKSRVDCKEESLGKCIEHIEHVEVKLAYMTPNEHGLKITLISPARTHSILMDKGQSMATDVWRKDVTFLSVNFWDESSDGTWLLIMHQHEHGTSKGTDVRLGIISFTLALSGTVKDIKKEPRNKTENFTKPNKVEQNYDKLSVLTERNGKHSYFDTSYTLIFFCFVFLYAILDTLRISIENCSDKICIHIYYCIQKETDNTPVLHFDYWAYVFSSTEICFYVHFDEI